MTPKPQNGQDTRVDGSAFSAWTTDSQSLAESEELRIGTAQRAAEEGPWHPQEHQGRITVERRSSLNRSGGPRWPGRRSG